jgi:hypothetical protein
MKIEIKRTHIRRGQQSDGHHCPIGLAIQESLGIDDSDKVFVGDDHIRIGKKKFDTPLEAIDFINAFDERKSSVEPFSFEL